MDNETPRLRALLEELHGELARQPALDEGRRTQLLELRQEIERILARTTAPASGPADLSPAVGLPAEERQQLRGRLQQLVVGFEGAHPQLAAAVEQAMNALSNLGL